MAQDTEQGVCVCVGEIVATHGVHGRVKIKTYTEHPENLTQYGDVTDDQGHIHAIRITSTKNTIAIAEIDGIHSRDDADALIGTRLYIARNALPDMENDTFYHHDLIGLDVRDTQGNSIGKIKEMHNFGAGDIVEVLLKATGKAEMFSFNRTNIPEIHMDKGYIVLGMPESIYAQESNT